MNNTETNNSSEFIECENWITADLYTYAIGNSLIHPEDTFEDWMNNRTDLIKIVRNDLNN